VSNTDRMGAQKNLTIAVTVNLEHYENLRLELSGEVGSGEDADNLTRFLDELLGKFGRQDPATAELVDSYRRRVFPAAGKQEVPTEGNRNEIGMILPDSVKDRSDQKTPEQVQVQSIEPVHAPQPTSPLAAPVAETLTCEICNGTVSLAEQKMSQLFTSRTLCRACLKKL
jgi:hypothetical protein